MSKKSSRKALAIALCATVMSGLYAVDVSAQSVQNENFTVNTGKGAYLDVNNDKVKANSDAASVNIDKDGISAGMNNGSSNLTIGKEKLETQVGSPYQDYTTIKQQEDRHDHTQQIELEARYSGKADSRLVVNNDRIDLDVNDRANDVHANRVVETDKYNGMKMWDQIISDDKKVTHDQSLNCIGNYVSEMAPDPDRPGVFVETDKRSSSTQTLGYIGNTVATAGYDYPGGGFIGTVREQSTSSTEDKVASKTYTNTSKQQSWQTTDTVKTNSGSSTTERVQDYGTIKETSKVASGNNSERKQDSSSLSGKVVDINGNTSVTSQNTSSLSGKVVDANGHTSETYQSSDLIRDSVKSEAVEGGYGWSSEHTQDDFFITDSVKSESADGVYRRTAKTSVNDLFLIDSVEAEATNGDYHFASEHVQGEWRISDTITDKLNDTTIGRNQYAWGNEDKATDNDGNTTRRSQGTTLINDNVVDGTRGYASGVLQNADKISSTVQSNKEDQPFNFTSNISQYDGIIDSKVAITSPEGDTYTEVKQDPYGVTVKDQNTKGGQPGEAGTFITAKDVSIEDGTNRIELSDVGQVDNINTDLKKVVGTQKMTAVKAINAETSERIANDIVGGDVSAKGEISLTKGNGEKVAVGTVSDNRLTDVKYAAASGDMTFTVEDKYGNDDPQTITVKDIASKSALDNEVNNRKEADTALETKINTEIDDRKAADIALETKINTEITNRQNNDIVGGSVDNVNGQIILNKGDQTNITIDGLTDNSLADASYDAATGKVTMTVKDKYGKDADQVITVEDIASKTVLDKEIKDRTDEDIRINGRIDQEIKERKAADAKETAERKAADAKETAERKAADAKETAERKAADTKETAERKAADVKETAERKAADAKETAERKAADAKETAERKAADAKETAERKAADAKETAERKAADAKEAAARQANDIVSGDISDKGDVTLTKGDGSKIDVGVVSDSRLTDARYNAEKGKLVFTVEDKYGNGTEKIKVGDIASKTVLDKEIKDRIDEDVKINNRIDQEIKDRDTADKTEAAARDKADQAEAAARDKADQAEAAARDKADQAEAAARDKADQAEAAARDKADQAEAKARDEADKAEAAARQANDIVSGDISAKGDVTLTKGDGSKLDVGVVSDSRLTDVDFTATSGEMTFTVEDKYGNGTETIKVSDIASKTVLDNEIKDRVAADKKEAAERKAADAKETAERIAADKKETEERIAADKKEAAERVAADKKEAAERVAADKKEAAERKAADAKETAERIAADKKETEERIAADKKETEERIAADKKETEERIAADKEEATIREANDIVSGDISAKGDVTLTKGDGSKIDVGVVSDSRLTDVDFTATSGEMTFTVEDKYGNGTETITVNDIASKTVVENEISQRKEADVVINGRIDQEITDRENADKAEAAARDKADKAEAAARDAADKALNARVDQEILDRDAADQAEAAARDKADKAEAAARDAADKALNARVDQEILDRDAADQAEAAARDKADKAEAAARQANDIVSGDISKKGEVTLTKGNGDKLDVGIVSDNRLTGANFVATSGTLTLTVEDKYGNDAKQTFTVTDIASKTVVENEINQRKEADVIINNRIDQEITDRQGADTVINNRITKLDGKLDKVGAGAAALAALHPMDFDADDKLSFAAGVGNYGGETVTALGAFYRPTEKVMLNAAGTLGSGENMVNMGISFALDKPNNVSNTRVAMAQEILELRAMVAEQGAQIQKLLMINKLTGAEELAAAMFPDVPENHWAYEYVDGLREQGILEGYEDGYFRGDRMMTRYEFAAMLFRALEKGVVLDERLANEFKPELGRIRVDRIKGIDTDTSKVERVRVVSDGNRDDYGYQVD